MVSWNRWASWVTTPTASCSDSWVTSRRSSPPMRTAPSLGSYSRDTRWVIVVLPAPDGPTRAVSCRAGAVKLTSCRTPRLASVRSGAGSAIDSSDARLTSEAAGYRNDTWSNTMSAAAPAVRDADPFVAAPEAGDPAGWLSSTSGTAPGRSSISGLRSSTSNTRSKLTSAVITLTCTLDSDVIGPYSLLSSPASATSAPTWNAPRMTRSPPTPYTTAVAIDASSESAMNSTLPYMAWVTPMSLTLAARPAKTRLSSSGLPNSLTSMAPATLKRSVIVEPIAASSCIDSRVSRCSLRPTSRAGMMNTGRRNRAMTVTSHE